MIEKLLQTMSNILNGSSVSSFHNQAAFSSENKKSLIERLISSGHLVLSFDQARFQRRGTD